MSEQSTNASGLIPSVALEGIDADALDETFDLLANQRRRHALRCLEEYDGTMTLADLADEVATAEHGTPITEISAEAVKRVYGSLYHTHVPKLAAAGVVQYDQEQDLVTLTPERRDSDATDDASS